MLQVPGAGVVRPSIEQLKQLMVYSLETKAKVRRSKAGQHRIQEPDAQQLSPRRFSNGDGHRNGRSGHGGRLVTPQ
jgi:hypothetical protein